MKKLFAILAVGVCALGSYYWLSREGVGSGKLTNEGSKQAEELDIVYDKPPKSEQEYPKELDADGDVRKQADLSREIAQLSENELFLELKIGREKIAREKLIERLNNKEASLDEINAAKELFERMALLALENANRKAKVLAPTIENGLEKLGQDLEEIKNLLRN